MEQTLQTPTEIKEKIAELRQSYARLRYFCGPTHISQQTINEYIQAIKELENKLKGGEEE